MTLLDKHKKSAANKIRHYDGAATLKHTCDNESCLWRCSIWMCWALLNAGNGATKVRP